MKKKVFFSLLLILTASLGYSQTARIGSQVWTTKNLEVTSFRNGDPIPEAKTKEEWIAAGKNGQPAWCYYNNDPANGSKYGKLYNWSAVNDPRGLAPVGFHIPSDAEWTVLKNHLGEDAGNKMKSSAGWYNNGNGSNSSGFSGLPGGGRDANGEFQSISGSGNWWSTTEYAAGMAWFYNVDCTKSGVYRSLINKSVGFSVRCIADSSTDTGDSFKKVYIGTQVWMTENLNVDKFRNGDPIPQARSKEEWVAAMELGQPAWCYYDNDPENGAIYGKLYNWYAVNDPRGLAPEGYYIPSDEDWTILKNYLGDNSGVNMKNESGWHNGKNGTNSSGFSGLPGGLRSSDGTFYSKGDFGYWWSCTESSEINVWSRFLSFNSSDLGSNNASRKVGLSVRCLAGPPAGNRQSSKEITIGNQVWMAENLNLDKFRNGDPIPEAKTIEEWEAAGKLGQPAWCYYDNDPANGAKYGKLYNWYAVNDPRGLAPNGYHIPSDAEWTTLGMLLGDDAGNKMKSTSGWLNNGNGSNITGFSGIPGGLRNGDGSFGSINYYGFWWSSTVNGTFKAWFREMGFMNSDLKKQSFFVGTGFSVRCIMN